MASARSRPQPFSAPRFLRSWTAQWALTFTGIVCIFLAGFNVSSFKELWQESWEGIVTLIGLGWGVKKAGDVVVQRERIKAAAPDAEAGD